MSASLPIVNLEEARFECTYGRGCEGLCCKNGRPTVFPDEKQRIDADLEKFLPHLRPEARIRVEKEGYLSRRMREGLQLVRVEKEWCVFFNQGCALHKVGAAEGDKNKYKPAACSLFPLGVDKDDRWYVRQHGYNGEKWDLFCLDPTRSTIPAAFSLAEELALALKYECEDQEKKAKESAESSLDGESP